MAEDDAVYVRKVVGVRGMYRDYLEFSEKCLKYGRPEAAEPARDFLNLIIEGRTPSTLTLSVPEVSSTSTDYTSTTAPQQAMFLSSKTSINEEAPPKAKFKRSASFAVHPKRTAQPPSRMEMTRALLLHRSRAGDLQQGPLYQPFDQASYLKTKEPEVKVKTEVAQTDQADASRSLHRTASRVAGRPANSSHSAPSLVIQAAPAPATSSSRITRSRGRTRTQPADDQV